jgi:hypothetical protein
MVPPRPESGVSHCTTEHEACRSDRRKAKAFSIVARCRAQSAVNDSAATAKISPRPTAIGGRPVFDLDQ